MIKPERKQKAGQHERRLLMARKSQQTGTLQWQNAQWTLLYRVKDHSTGRVSQKRESAAFAQFRDRNDKKAAREFAVEFLRPINRLNSNPHTARQVNPQPEATFEWFIKSRWASYVHKRKMQPATVKMYNCFINKHLLPTFGPLPLVEISTGRLTDFFDGLYGKLKESSIGNIYRLLSLMFDIMVEYDLIESKPLRKKLHKPEYEREEKPTLPVEDARNILKALSYSHRLFITTLGVFSIRVNEAAALRWMNLDFESGVLSLTHSTYKRQLKATLKSRASRRKFEIPKPLLEVFRQWRAASPFNGEEDFIFPNEIGEPINFETLRRCVLYPLMDKLKIKRGKGTHGFHIWRHTAATLLRVMTGNIETAQKALGHASRSTTESYYDHAPVVVEEETTTMLLDWLTGSDYELLGRTDTVH